MFSRYIDKFDFKSRFRILKGGKVSLVVSAMLVGGLVNIANAALTDIHISDEQTSVQAYSINEYNLMNLYIDPTGKINIQESNASNVIVALKVEEGSGQPIYTVDNQGEIVLNVTGSASSDQLNLFGFQKIGTTYGKTINSGTMNITSSLTTPVSTLNTIGIYDDIVTYYTNTEEAEIINSGTLNVSSDMKLDISANKSDIVARVSSEGIQVRRITSNINSGPIIYSLLKNSGTIDVKSKLEFAFDEEGLAIGNAAIDSPVYAQAIGIHNGYNGGSFYYGKILNDGTINSLAEVIVDDKGRVYSYYGGGYAESFGIKADSGMSYSYIENTGTIDSKASMSAGSYSDAYSDGIYFGSNVDHSAIISNILNSTAIANSSDGNAYAKAHGINAYNFTLENTFIANSDSLEVKAEATGTEYAQAKAYGMELKDAYQVIVWNAENATIDVTAKSISDENPYADSYALYIRQLANADSSGIANEGDIISTSIAQGDSPESYAKGIYISKVLANSTNNILNSGTITANAKFTANNNSYDAASAGIVSEYMYENSTLTLDNSGTIEGLINDELDKDGYSVVMHIGPATSTLSVINSGTLRGNIFVSGSLENSGTVELAYNAMDSYLANIGYFTNKSAGILKIGLKTDGTFDGTQYSQLTTREATFENNSTIDVNVLNSSSNVALLAGNKLNGVVMASDALTINGKLNITDNSALLNFEYETTDTQGETFVNGQSGIINLNVVKAKDGGGDKTILSSTIAGNGNKNDQNAAKALETLYNQNNGIASAFNKLPTDSSIAKAVESTTPVATNSTVGAASQISSGIAGIVTQRQNANISASGGLNSGDGIFSENNLWIKPFGSIGSQNNKDGINGFDLKTYGLGFGADTEYKDNQRIGLAFFYTNGDIDTNNVSQKADLDVYTTLVYGNIPIIDDKTNFLYQAGYSWQKTNTKRDVFTGETAEAKYTSEVANLDLKLMRDVNISDKLLLQPLVNTTYRHFKNPNYSESGAGALNLNVDKFTTSELIVGLGTLAHYKLTDSSKLVTSLNVGYDLQNKEQTVTSAFQGASGVKFGTDGIDNGRWSYEAGIGYELDINKTNNINISYDYQAQGSDFSNNVISAKYVLKF
ncbi:autotransporter domain-containing protein [Aliarcobacter butzleri]